jgi:hypothetical protein
MDPNDQVSIEVEESFESDDGNNSFEEWYHHNKIYGSYKRADVDHVDLVILE